MVMMFGFGFGVGVGVIFVLSWTVGAGDVPIVITGRRTTLPVPMRTIYPALPAGPETTLSPGTEPTTLLTLVVPSNTASTASTATTTTTAADLVQDLHRQSELTEPLLLVAAATNTNNENDNDNDEAKHHTCVAHAEAARGLWNRFCANPLVLVTPQCWTRAPSVKSCCTKGKEPTRSCIVFLPGKERGGAHH